MDCEGVYKGKAVQGETYILCDRRAVDRRSFVRRPTLPEGRRACQSSY